MYCCMELSYGVVGSIRIYMTDAATYLGYWISFFLWCLTSTPIILRTIFDEEDWILLVNVNNFRGISYAQKGTIALEELKPLCSKKH